MTILDSDNRDIREIVHWEGYQDLAAKFDQLFFDHLKAAAQFSLHLTRWGNWALKRSYLCVQDICYMFAILNLRNIFISQNLVDIFI
ncbi:hypothetical protein ABVK25_004574 [Lepraria finkii]|uniref:Uncharacterized protein n=1 Tax=Lepraria finkii TaxID=1340010 RepID=A0ABR4BDY3_9LECA